MTGRISYMDSYMHIWISAGPTLGAGSEGKVEEGRRGRGRE